MEQNMQQPPVFNNSAIPAAPHVLPQMSFVESIKTCFAKYKDFSGRARRSEFWWFILCYWLTSTIVGQITNMGGLMVSFIAQGVVFVIFALPCLAVQVRRLHDTNHSSLLAWLFFIVYTAMMVVSCQLISIIGEFIDGAGTNTALPERVVTENMSLFGITGILGLLFCVVGLILLIFSAKDSDAGTNTYGPSPKYQ